MRREKTKKNTNESSTLTFILLLLGNSFQGGHAPYGLLAGMLSERRRTRDRSKCGSEVEWAWPCRAAAGSDCIKMSSRGPLHRRTSFYLFYSLFLFIWLQKYGIDDDEEVTEHPNSDDAAPKVNQGGGSMQLQSRGGNTSNVPLMVAAERS